MKKLVVACIALAVVSQAQQPANRPAEVVTLDKTPVYRVTVVSRTAKAINYRHRSGATKVDFQGTSLLPGARGEAKVESKKGYIEIEVEFDGLQTARKFGNEYLTYVMWAISPEGRATNLGEVLLDSSGRGKLNVTTELQAFGLVVTAEPYFAVSQPSDLIVLENVVRSDTQGRVEMMEANYELLQRGQYIFNATESELRTLSGDPGKVPLDLYEAKNAVQIARWTGADRYAKETWEKARFLLQQAEDYHARNQRKPSSMVARQATQTAEDARLIALKRIEEERLATERRIAAEREASAKAEAAAAEARRKAEEERRMLEEQRRAQADAERRAAERAKAEALAAEQSARRAQAEAEAARAAALAQQQAAQLEAEKARLAAADADRQRLSAEAEKEKMRKQLLEQLNVILETRDSARGLIVNMSDVLFDTGKHTLKPGAREKLARVSGIVLAYPGLRLDIEGHTDSVGGDEYNQRLSERRAESVRDYLLSQGVAASNLSAKGFGETMPVASNDNATGRQQNRRVELVVSGEVIGTSVTQLRVR